MLTWSVDEVIKIILSKVALRGLDCCSREETNHFIEEAIPGEGNQVTFLDLFEISAGDFSDVVCCFCFVTAFCGEGTKIVGSPVK